MNFIRKYYPYLAGVLLGAVAGYAYYHFVGCNGTCMISSSPVNSTVYGAIMGVLFVNAFGKKKRKEA